MVQVMFESAEADANSIASGSRPLSVDPFQLEGHHPSDFGLAETRAPHILDKLSLVPVVAPPDSPAAPAPLSHSFAPPTAEPPYTDKSVQPCERMGEQLSPPLSPHAAAAGLFDTNLRTAQTQLYDLSRKCAALEAVAKQADADGAELKSLRAEVARLNAQLETVRREATQPSLAERAASAELDRVRSELAMRGSEVAALQEDKRTLQRSVADLSATAAEKDRLVAELRKRMEEVQKKAADVPLRRSAEIRSPPCAHRSTAPPHLHGRAPLRTCFLCATACVRAAGCTAVWATPLLV